MQTLFRSDRMIVKGEIKTYSNFICATDGELICGQNEKKLNLEFIFQVNGKITQYSYDFHISVNEESKRLDLVNWYEWYPVSELFFAMGYNFGNNPFSQSNAIIIEWINICNGPKEQ